ncbi:hypothetical protein [Bosea sp. 685]|uniref:hypothetical protein n=1 Tax=Bosea sp. 685 TaxID=3080057 RepID=UPI002892B0ED|nr:hypothetical protein [Bosea sp. 685]WNJ93550.1 hypothetical protein RMR04_15205 [Bosea sp. 685]
MEINFAFDRIVEIGLDSRGQACNPLGKLNRKASDPLRMHFHVAGEDGGKVFP